MLHQSISQQNFQFHILQIAPRQTTQQANFLRVGWRDKTTEGHDSIVSGIDRLYALGNLTSNE